MHSVGSEPSLLACLNGPLLPPFLAVSEGVAATRKSAAEITGRISAADCFRGKECLYAFDDQPVGKVCCEESYGQKEHAGGKYAC